MNEMINRAKEVFLPTYAQFPIVLSKGDKVHVTDSEGNRYIDMVAGIAVNSLGYNDRQFTDALKEVIENGLLHCSNLYYNRYAVEAASYLKELSGMDKVFFCNSGTEANEGALKLARKYGKSFPVVREKIITMESSFHGRTYGSMSATGQVKYQKNFTPLVPKIVHSPLNDFESLADKVGDDTCAIFIEVIQGEGGIKCADPVFLSKVRELCDEKEILLVFDEVQCGMGRTGKAFAWQNTDVIPDVMTLAKALGNGVPIGAMVVSSKASEIFSPGDHAATFGGNLLSCAAACVVLKRISHGKLLEHVETVGAYFKKQLEQLAQTYGVIKEVRGLGLMLGVELTCEAKPVIDMCMKEGMLIVGAGANVLRFVPPLIIEKADVDEVISILSSVLAKI